MTLVVPLYIFKRRTTELLSAAHVPRKTRLRSPLSHRTYVGSPSWSSDRHLQWCVIVAGFDANASEPPPPNRAGAIDGFKKSPQIPHSSDRRLLQQNRHKAYLLTALGNRLYTRGCKCLHAGCDAALPAGNPG